MELRRAEAKKYDGEGGGTVRGREGEGGRMDKEWGQEKKSTRDGNSV